MKTIAAISTAAAPGGIGVIRISGDEARVVGDRVFKSVSGAKLCDMAGYTCRFGHVYAPDGEHLDECVATVFAAPHSFTGEDVVEETVLLGEIPLRLADTAGIRDTEDRVERIGVRMALDRVKTAQFVLAVFDASEELNDDDRALMDAIGDTPAVAVINKSDLAPKIDRAEIDKHFKEVVTVSALSGEGLPALQNAAARALKTAELNPNDGILYTERQRADVQKALTALEEAENALLMGMTWDAVTVSLEGAIAALNELTGERVSDAVVDQVFEKFCVGK